MKTVSIADLTRFTEDCFRKVGMRDADARAAAEALVTTDAMGVFTHGTKALIGYLKKLKGGGYGPTATPVIEREGPGWAVIDGASALGQVGSIFAMQTAMKKARDVGIAYVGLRNTGHIGAAGFYSVMAAKEGFITTVTGNDMPSVAAPGSRGPVLGSNPIAFGIPVDDGHPIFLDIATAAVAGGKVYAAHQRGEPIPPTWIIDKEGQPTTDGSLYPFNASLAPMAGHKGYGFGLWCEILSAVLPGGNMTWQVGSWIFDEPSQPSWHNASFVAISVDVIASRAEFGQRTRALVDEIHAVPTADGVESVLVPGEREWQNFHRAVDDGIPLPQDVIDTLQEAAEFMSVPMVS